jgi:hypothetical protein
MSLIAACGSEPEHLDADCVAACTRIAEIHRLCGWDWDGDACAERWCADPAESRHAIRCADCATWRAASCGELGPACATECGG